MTEPKFAFRDRVLARVAMASLRLVCFVLLAAHLQAAELRQTSLAQRYRAIALPDGSWPTPADPTLLSMFGTAPEAFVSRSEMLELGLCAQYIGAADAWTKARGGWEGTSGVAPLSELELPAGTLDRFLREVMLPALSARYPAASTDTCRLRLLSGSVQRHVPGAEPAAAVGPGEAALLSVAVALNEPKEYTGAPVSHVSTLL